MHWIKEKSCLNIFIYPILNGYKWVYRNKENEIDLTKYWNNFDLIKKVTE